MTETRRRIVTGVGGLAGALAAGGAVATVAMAQTAPGPTRLTPGLPGAAGPVPGVWLAGDPDRRFIEEMIPHHQDAVDMAGLALARAEHPEVRGLATAIEATQTEEIAQMTAWYRAWYGGDVPPSRMGAGPGAGRGFAGRGMMGGPAGMMGMTGRRDPAALTQAQPFDKAFIEQMVPHHQMAVMMSAMTLPGARRPELIALLQSIVAGQSAEIRQMGAWYRVWYG